MSGFLAHNCEEIIPVAKETLLRARRPYIEFIHFDKTLKAPVTSIRRGIIKYISSNSLYEIAYTLMTRERAASRVTYIIREISKNNKLIETIRKCLIKLLSDCKPIDSRWLCIGNNKRAIIFHYPYIIKGKVIGWQGSNVSCDCLVLIELCYVVFLHAAICAADKVSVIGQRALFLFWVRWIFSS